MGKLNRPTVVLDKRASVSREHKGADTVTKSSFPDEAKTRDTSPANNNHSPKVLLLAVQSDFDRAAQPARRATVSFGLSANHRSRANTLQTTLTRSRLPSNPPMVQSLSPSSLRSISPLLRGRDLQRAIQDRYPSILESLNNHSGDAQASPSHEQDTTDGGPIDAAVRHVQERGRSARAEALQTVGMLLKRLDQQKIEKEEVRNVLFMTCTDAFARNPLDNVAEVSLAFQLLCVLVQEDIMQVDDFVKAATMLAEEGHRDGCKLLIKLALDDKKLKLAPGEADMLTAIMPDLDPDQSEGKARPDGLCRCGCAIEE